MFVKDCLKQKQKRSNFVDETTIKNVKTTITVLN